MTSNLLMPMAQCTQDNKTNITRWVKLNDLNFDIINWSVKDKFIDILH